MADNKKTKNSLKAKNPNQEELKTKTSEQHTLLYMKTIYAFTSSTIMAEQHRRLYIDNGSFCFLIAITAEQYRRLYIESVDGPPVVHHDDLAF